MIVPFTFTVHVEYIHLSTVHCGIVLADIPIRKQLCVFWNFTHNILEIRKQLWCTFWNFYSQYSRNSKKKTYHHQTTTRNELKKKEEVGMVTVDLPSKVWHNNSTQTTLALMQQNQYLMLESVKHCHRRSDRNTHFRIHSILSK